MWYIFFFRPLFCVTPLDTCNDFIVLMSRIEKEVMIFWKHISTADSDLGVEVAPKGKYEYLMYSPRRWKRIRLGFEKSWCMLCVSPDHSWLVMAPVTWMDREWVLYSMSAYSETPANSSSVSWRLHQVFVFSKGYKVVDGCCHLMPISKLGNNGVCNVIGGPGSRWCWYS